MYAIVAEDTDSVLSLGSDNVRELVAFGRISLCQSDFRRTVDVDFDRRRSCSIHTSYREFRRMAWHIHTKYSTARSVSLIILSCAYFIRPPDLCRWPSIFPLCFWHQTITDGRTSPRKKYIRNCVLCGIGKSNSVWHFAHPFHNFYRGGAVTKVRNLVSIFYRSRLWGALVGGWSNVSEMWNICVGTAIISIMSYHKFLVVDPLQSEKALEIALPSPRGDGLRILVQTLVIQKLAELRCVNAIRVRRPRNCYKSKSELIQDGWRRPNFTQIGSLRQKCIRCWALRWT